MSKKVMQKGHASSCKSHNFGGAAGGSLKQSYNPPIQDSHGALDTPLRATR